MKAYQESIFAHFQGQNILSYRFENDLGCQLTVMTYGATVLEYLTPDRQGQLANIVIGFDRFEDYVGNSPKYGASIGPVAGRIAQGRFELNGETYQLEVNNGQNCNHSGWSGWDTAVFEVREVSDQGLVLYTERPDGSGGFPGNLKVWLAYSLTEEGELEISYQVETDQDTLVNPTNHSYFNLSGDVGRTIDDHILQLQTKGIYPIAGDGVPAKEIDGERPFLAKLRQGAFLKDIFAAEDEQIQLVSGLDHPFALEQDQDWAGSLYHPESGRLLTFRTEAPCLVLYSANFVDETVILQGSPMIQHNGLALETQVLPDAIHSDWKDQVILKAGQTFTSRTIYRASVRE